MRYWGWFAAKLGLVGAFQAGLLWLLNTYWPVQSFVLTGTFLKSSLHVYRAPRFGYDLSYTLLVGLWFMLGSVLVYLAWMDQRHRCRVCLRRLRMPVETGSWGSMLQFGRPRIEYICPYGHGTLKESEVQISGLENPEWEKSPDMWEQLKS